MEMNPDREREILKIIQYDLTDGALVAYLKKLQLVGNYFINRSISSKMFIKRHKYFLRRRKKEFNQGSA